MRVSPDSFHESGHAYAAVVQRVPFTAVRIFRGGGGDLAGFDSHATAIVDFVIFLAGPVSEALFRGGFKLGDDPVQAWRLGLQRADISCWSVDFEHMQRLRTRMPGGTADRAAEHVILSIGRMWSSVQSLARVLARRKTLSQSEVRQIVFRKEQG